MTGACTHCASAADVQNSTNDLLKNPAFDSSLSSGWMVSSSAITRSSSDVYGCSGSGSALIPSGEILSQCYDMASANVAYTFGFYFMEDQAGSIGCYLTWTSDPACNNDLSRWELIPDSTTIFTTWTLVSTTSTSPPGTEGIRIQCLGGPGNVTMDQVFLTH